MGAIPFTRQRGKAGTFYFKRRAPGGVLDALRTSVWKNSPTRTHWDISLKTRDRHEAFKRAAQHVEETDALIAQASKTQSEQEAVDHAAEKQAQKLAEAERLVADLGPAEQDHVASAGGVEALQADAARNAKWANLWTAGVEGTENNIIEKALRETQTQNERLDAQIEKATNRAGAAEARAIVRDQTRILQKLGLDLDKQLESFKDTEPGLKDALDHYIDERGLPEQTTRQYGYAVRRFNEYHGDMPVAKITRDHFWKFAKAIHGLPAGRAHGVLDMPFKAAVDCADEKQMKRISEATRKRHLTAIRAIVAHAFSVFDIGVNKINPLAGVQITKKRMKVSEEEADERLPFTHDEIEAITNFTAERFEPNEDDYWPPLIAKWQGMRLNEICQLYRVDIDPDALSIRITDEGETQHLKTKHSKRTIPIHPELLRLGFLTLLDRPEHHQLFPSFPYRKGIGHGEAYGKRIGRIIREAVGITDRRKVFHSFRHAWIDAARDTEMPGEIRKAMSGHKLTDSAVENAYGRGYTVEKMREWMVKVSYT